MKMTQLDEHLAQEDRSGHFDGHVKLQRLVTGEESREVELLGVFFSACARTKPHIHPKDQVLYFVQGKGLVATEQEKHICVAGDVITVPEGTWHWHGATRESAACHLSIKQPGDTNWEVELKNWASGYDE